MNDYDLPPHLRESNQQRRPPELQIPLAPPEMLDVPPPPPPEPEEKDDRPVDPFLRRG